MNQGERLSSIETILERIEKRLDAIEIEVRADKAELAALKNRGIGLLAGVGLIATLIGFKIDTIVKALADALK